MPDLTTTFAGIESPNPFWLASGPPTNTYGQVARAFDSGWGGAIWKTVGEPVVNVYSRYGSVDLGANRMMGFNNIELISDRPIEDNLREIAEVKRNYPDNAVIVSLMVESKREAWHEMVKRAEDTGADGLELNFGCPHGMSERGMGAAVGQVPEYARDIVGWVKEVATTPVIAKLTPNVTDITYAARASVEGGADALSLINTINSIVGVDLDTFTPRPDVGGQSSHGGYCGPAVKPIALHLLSAVAGDAGVPIPISGIGGISTWRDAAEFIALGAGNVQVCTAVMHHGFRVVEDMIDGLSGWMDDKGMARSRISVAWRCPRWSSGSNSTSTTTWWPRSTRRSAFTASCVGWPARTALTRRSGVISGPAASRWSRSSRKRAWGAISASRSARCMAVSPWKSSGTSTRPSAGARSRRVKGCWRRGPNIFIPRCGPRRVPDAG